jgi:hypothetical protein
MKLDRPRVSNQTSFGSRTLGGNSRQDTCLNRVLKDLSQFSERHILVSLCTQR